MNLVYSAEAVEDLKRLREFIAEQNPAAANKVAAELVLRLENLKAFPEIGRRVELSPTPDTIRDFVFGNYIVRYALHSKAVVVLRIWHHYEIRE